MYYAELDHETQRLISVRECAVGAPVPAACVAITDAVYVSLCQDETSTAQAMYEFVIDGTKTL